MATAEQGPDWVTVFTGRGPQLGLVEEALQARGLTVVRTPLEGLADYSLPVGILGAQSHMLCKLSVSPEEFAARETEIRAVVQECGASDGDPAAQAEAEEDFDVRACPKCQRFFHDNYATCPGDGVRLVPAVECLGPGESEPDFVVVADGPAGTASTLALRYQDAGFQAAIASPAGWPISLVELPWQELITRTVEAESLLRQP